jgi:cation diffusion facilitator family transporter
VVAGTYGAHLLSADPRAPGPARYVAVSRVLVRVLLLNLSVAIAKIAFGYASGAISILSDGFHSLTDAASNVVGIVGVRAAGRPPDEDHPYGHRKYETVAAAAIPIFLILLMLEVLRNTVNHLTGHDAPVAIPVSGFAVMLITVGVNLFVIWYESREAERLASEVLLADATQTRADVWTSITVIAALAGMRSGVPMLDPLAALVVVAFIGYAGFQIVRATTAILSDRMVIADADLERVDQDARVGRSCVPGPARLAAARHASYRRTRAVARRQGPAHDAVPANRGRDHSHRTTACGMNEWPERFLAFERRKVGAATEAVLPPYTTDFDRTGPLLNRIASPWTSAIFDGPFCLSPIPAAVPATSIVFVQSADGNTGARNPSTLGGGATDTHLIYEGLSRAAADAVLAGAETVRGGDMVLSVWHPELVALRQSLGRPRHPAQIVATIRGVALSDQLMFNLPEIPVVLLTVRRGADAMRDALAARPWISAIVMDNPGDLAGAFAELQRMNIARISAIGGRTMAHALLTAGLIQDAYLTTSPVEGGEPNTAIDWGSTERTIVLRKCGTGPETGVIFEHLTVTDR